MFTKKEGFTLIELLVVIAIIALLAAILFPVFARARENARRTACQSNLKQIGLGIMQYTQDYDERLPTDWNFGAADEASNWMARINPYVKSTQLFVCPSNSFKTSIPSSGLWPGAQTGSSHPNYMQPFHSSYGYNRNLTSGPASTNNAVTVGLKISAVNSVAKTVMVTDGGAIPDAATAPQSWSTEPGAFLIDDMNPARDTAYLTGTGSLYQLSVSGPFARHLETCNVLWVDGHVKAQKIDSFYSATASTDSPCLDPNTGCP